MARFGALTATTGLLKEIHVDVRTATAEVRETALHVVSSTGLPVTPYKRLDERTPSSRMSWPTARP